MNVRRINLNRLQLLIAALFALTALAYGVPVLLAEYKPFANRMIREHQISYIERKTGKSFAEWEKERSAVCLKEAADLKPTGAGPFSLFPEETKDQYYRRCMKPVFVLVPEGKILVSFALSVAPRTLLYVFASVAVSWLLSYLLVKGIPAGVARLWVWLTSGGRSQ